MKEDLKKVKLVAVGSGAGNVASHMRHKKGPAIPDVHIDTERGPLEKSGALETLLLGDNGMGSGGRPDIARKAAEANKDRIRQALANADIVFITSCLGGGTGSGAVPVVAQLAQEMGIYTIGVVTTPFTWEGARRMEHAKAAIAEIEKEAHALLILANDRIEAMMGEDTELGDAFTITNDTLKDTVSGILEIIGNEIQLDLEDVKEVLQSFQQIAVASTTLSGPDRAQRAVDEVLASPLLANVEWAKVQSALIWVSGSKESLKLSESRIIMTAISEKMIEEASIASSMSYNEDLGDAICVKVIVGFASAEK